MKEDILDYVYVEGWASLTELKNEFGEEIDNLLYELVVECQLELAVIDEEAYYTLA